MAPKALRFARIALSALVVCLSISVLATASDALRTYKQERDALNPWWLPLWPNHFDTSGTTALIGISAVITVLHLIYMIATGVPRFTLFQAPKFAWLLAMLVTVPSAILAIVAIAFPKVVDNNSGETRLTNSDTIMTWTCKFRNAQPTNGGLDVKPYMTNAQFGKMCDESRFAYYTMIPIFLLQFVMIIVAFVEWRSAGATPKEQEKEYEYSGDRDSPVEFAVNPK